MFLQFHKNLNYNILLYGTQLYFLLLKFGIWTKAKLEQQQQQKSKQKQQ